MLPLFDPRGRSFLDEQEFLAVSRISVQENQAKRNPAKGLQRTPPVNRLSNASSDSAFEVDWIERDETECLD
jgi:hypothetical protein